MQQKEAERSLEKYLKFPYESVEELKMENRLSGGEIILRSGRPGELCLRLFGRIYAGEYAL